MSVDKIFIFDIKRFSLHDGPGIRTVIFTKGCPLRCLWCANPEGISNKYELAYFVKKCVRCGRCAAVCPPNCITVTPSGIHIDRDRCILCGLCAQECMEKALAVIGRYMSADQISEIIRKDRIFYKNSGGGITISGGEPMMQYDKVYHILSQCKTEGIGTAIETSGYTSEEVMAKFVQVVDYLLFDIKCMDHNLHKKYTGVENELILSNLEYAVREFRHVIARYPYIPGYNDDQADDILRLISKLKIKELDILPYHELGIHKYHAIGREYTIPKSNKVDACKLQNVVDKGLKLGIDILIGG